MRTLIKRGVVALTCLLAVSTTALAGNDKPITVEQLPQAARTMINTHFKDKEIILTKQETGLASKNYDVVFSDGTKIEFNSKGQWTEVECKRSAVPARLVPQAITASIRNNYPSAKIVGIEKNRSDYEVKLNNGLEVKYNKKFQIIDIDD